MTQYRLLCGEHTDRSGTIFFMFSPEQAHRYQPVAGGFIEKGRPERVYPTAEPLTTFPYVPVVLVESESNLEQMFPNKFQRWNP